MNPVAKNKANNLPNQKDLPTESSESSRNNAKKKFFIGGAIILFGLVIIGLEFLGYISLFGLVKKDKDKLPTTIEKKEEIGPIINMQPMTINLKEEDGSHYLRIKIAIEVSDKKWVEEVQSKMSILNDLIIMIICEKELNDLKVSGFKDQIKEELLKEMNYYFQPGQLRQIFFEEFLYQ